MRLRASAAFLALAVALSGQSGAAAYEAHQGRPQSDAEMLDQPVMAGRQILVRLDPGHVPPLAPRPEYAQAISGSEKAILEIEAQGFSKIKGLMRRGENYVFQALDPYGDRVRVVMNARTGEIIGFSRIVPRKK